MSGINCELDIREDSVYDIKINRNRTLNQVFEAYFLSGNTEVPFDFSPYSGATLEVKKNYASEHIILTFSTSDGSIVLGVDGQFSLVKSADDLDKVRANNYQYDMYLSNTSSPKRAFLSGDFIISDYITQ